MTQAVILAGGKGTRLASRLQGRPKPLIDVCGTPLLERQLQTLSSNGVDDFVVLVSHAADQIERFLADRGGGWRTRLMEDSDPRGTAGAVLASLPDLADRFLVVYGDTLFDIDVAHMLAAHEAAGADATLLLHPNDHPADSDLVELDREGFISAFHSHPHAAGVARRNLVNAAFYVVERRALGTWRSFPAPCDFAQDLFPAMLAKGSRLKGYLSFEYIKDIGTPERLDKAEGHLRAGVIARARRQSPQKAVFLDRDGVLNALRGHIRTPTELELLPGAADAVRRLNEAEYRVVVATNQPVIARGECTEDGLRAIHDRLEHLLGLQGGRLDAVYYCPHHPDAGYAGEVASLKVACDCRKPATALVREAAHALNIRLSASWMVGDSTADILAAKRAGLKSILVRTGEGGRDRKYVATPDFIADDLVAAATFIIDAYPRLAAIVERLVGQVAPGDLILVGGLARSGKSTLAGVIGSELLARGVAASAISLDRWILPAAERGAGVMGRYALERAASDLRAWLEGGEASFAAPTYDRLARARGPLEDLTIPHDAVMILEGAPALTRDWTKLRRTRRLFVGADEAARRERVIADLMHRGLGDAAEALRVYDLRQADEAPVIVESQARADQVLTLDSVLGIVEG